MSEGTNSETSLIAWLTTSGNPLGADAGISVEESVRAGGAVRETVELAREAVTDGSLDDPDEADGICYDGVAAVLRGMGFEILQPWAPSGGQYAAEVALIL
jgi:hypothetical protein